jgi:hypothetical protein
MAKETNVAQATNYRGIVLTTRHLTTQDLKMLVHGFLP